MIRRNNRFLAFLQLLALFVTSDSFLVRPNGATVRRLHFTRKQFSLFQTSEPHIGGLMNHTDFERLNQFNTILNQLRQELPLLLQKPLSVTLLAPDMELCVGDTRPIFLASSREEILRLQQIIILTLRAGNLVQYQPPIAQCRLVRWQVDLTSSPQQPVVLDGESVFEINGTLIQTLRLEKVNFNGQPQDAVTIGRFLSSSRRAVQQVQSSPFLQPFLTSLSPLLDTILSSSSNNSRVDSTPSESASAIFLIRNVNTTGNTKNATKQAFQWLPLEDETSNSTTFPLPGSKVWAKYAALHQRATQFYETVLPALQDGTVNEAYFAKDATLSSKDILIQNPRRFYQMLAIGRQQSGARFQCTGIRAVWHDNAVHVSYTTSIPSLSAPIRFRGVDVFEFNDEESVQIANIQQVKFQNEDPSSTNWDGALVMRSLAAAVETGRPETWADLVLLPKSGQPRSLPARPRSDTAAVTIYRIMERLHVDLRLLAVQNETAVVPAGKYLEETVQLTGYLNETLVKGSVLYSRSVLLAVQSLKAALGSHQIKSKQAPTVRIELTEHGNIRCALTLFLQLVGGVPASVPLKLQIDFEYRVDPDTGKIVQHRLLESRINNQLTPGDVVSRWIKRFTDPTSKLLDDEDWIGSALDTIKWVRSLRPE